MGCRDRRASGQTRGGISAVCSSPRLAGAAGGLGAPPRTCPPPWAPGVTQLRLSLSVAGARAHAGRAGPLWGRCSQPRGAVTTWEAGPSAHPAAGSPLPSPAPAGAGGGGLVTWLSGPASLASGRAAPCWAALPGPACVGADAPVCGLSSLPEPLPAPRPRVEGRRVTRPHSRGRGLGPRVSEVGGQGPRSPSQGRQVGGQRSPSQGGKAGGAGVPKSGLVGGGRSQPPTLRTAWPAPGPTWPPGDRVSDLPSSSVCALSPQMDHDPRNPAYIATQGPLPTTVADFWQVSPFQFFVFQKIRS